MALTTCDVSTFILFIRQIFFLFQNWSAKSALSILISLSLSGRTSVKRRHWPWWFQSSVPHKVRWEIDGKFIILRIFHTPHFPYSSFSILRTPHSALLIFRRTRYMCVNSEIWDQFSWVKYTYPFFAKQREMYLQELDLKIGQER